MSRLTHPPEVTQLSNGAYASRVGNQNDNRRPIVLLNGLGAGLMTGEFPEMLADKTERPVWSVDVRQALGNYAFRLKLLPTMSDLLYPPFMAKMEDYSQALSKSLGELDIEKPHLVGFSWGGLLATEYAMDPLAHRASSLTTMGSSGGLTFPFPRAEALQAMLTPTRDEEHLSAEMIGNVFGGTLKNPLVVNRLSEVLHRQIDVKSYQQQLGAAATCGHNMMRLALPSSLPRLAIGGEDDPVTPWPNIEIIQALNPALTQIHRIDGEGHYFPLLRTEETTDVIARRIADISEASIDLGAAA